MLKSGERMHKIIWFAQSLKVGSGYNFTRPDPVKAGPDPVAILQDRIR